MNVTVLIIGFIAAAAATWAAGIFLSRTTDILDDRLNLGQAMGGMILLAIAGSLPELAITVSAALNQNLGMAAGNLIGGIAIQTLVLAICDFVVRGKRPLSALMEGIMPALEGLLVIGVVALVFMGAILPESVAFRGVSPISVLIVVAWLGGMFLLNRARKQPAWQQPAGEEPPPAVSSAGPEQKGLRAATTGRVALVFAVASIVTLIAGVVLERTGDQLATHFGINGVIFGATFLALASALPEISTGVAAVRMGAYGLVMGDIFGGNAFQVCLFLVADLLAGSPALPDAGISNEWLAGLGVVITTIYTIAILIRPQRRHARLGLDSWLAILTYVIGLAGLLALSR